MNIEMTFFEILVSIISFLSVLVFGIAAHYFKKFESEFKQYARQTINMDKKLAVEQEKGKARDGRIQKLEIALHAKL